MLAVTSSMEAVPDRSTTSAGSGQADRLLNRTELAERAGVPSFVVDLAADAGLITPSNGSDEHDDGFTADHVEMLIAARTLIEAGVAIEEMTALGMRHAANVENLIDDAIDMLKRRIHHSSHNSVELIESVNRLIPVATKLVTAHFERTLFERAMARIGDEPVSIPSVAGTVLVTARRARERIDPLSVYAAAANEPHRSLWLRPEAGMGLAALGVVEAIAPVGVSRFSEASAARAVLAARVQRHGPTDAPAPVIVGGFSFAPSEAAAADAQEAETQKVQPVWQGFGDCWLVLPEVTVLNKPDGTWLMAAARIGSDGDEAVTLEALQRRLDAIEAAAQIEAKAEAMNPVESSERADAAQTSVSGMSGANSPDVEPESAKSDASLHCADRYKALVREVVAAVERGELRKAVLARAVQVERDINVTGVLKRLRARNPACATFAFTVGQATFLGSTPEELVTLQGSRLNAVALAGTTPRGSAPADDERLAAELLASAKNRSEHRIVVEGIIDALSSLGLVDTAPAEPGLLRLNRVQHLCTEITAEVKRRRSGASDMDVLRVAGVLHPTPAVGGAPTEAALQFIARNEGFDRGWYSAPVGWCDLDGNGELGVALRCALARPGMLHLFAGAGIVAGSDPDDELAETVIKLQAFLDALD